MSDKFVFKWAEEEPSDQKKYLEDSCQPRCVKTLLEYKACVQRIEGDDSGHKHCTGQYFDYWQCVDKCTLQILLNLDINNSICSTAKILPVVRNQHLLLCTLLICNTAAMEALPIFLDGLVTAWGAILISVTSILLFGEIIPQSVCSRYGLAIGATVAPFVRVLVCICFPVAYPISKLLDYLLGHGHAALFRRADLKTLVDMHGNEAGKGGELTHDETTIIAGALELSEKTASDAMTPISDTFAVDINARLDRD
ncbi:putative Magnesium and cobalt efflux protein CorC [Heracleum sosnowskyi]|uniref:Complex III subunit VI n=1 Tax=Heracleum sosnowskyi TaxID=360622 RepID=A0AAD8HP65_9APIA|nr:putative Magnesium and cobalt efflux protein CorC [Heracleum sosnowskyi]